jgi:predicted transcriptional regulator YdeE
MDMTAQHFDSPDDLIILGIALRTSADAAARDIPGFWQRFEQEGIAGRLPRRRGDDGSIYAVYCDYERDARGPYTMVLGVAIDAETEVPAGMRRVRIPAGHYARFVVTGNPAQVIWQAWMYIVGEWEHRHERRYIADYERYAPDAMAGGTVQADIVVGLSSSNAARV